MSTAPDRREIPTLVKDEDLVQRKRRLIADAAVRLFCAKGYHPATTREIAREAGCSIGSLYEYVASKEDILYLVCDSIHAEMEVRVQDGLRDAPDARGALIHAIDGYIRVCDKMQDSILLIYRETASLDEASRRCVLANEERIARYFEEILERGRADGSLRIDPPNAAALMAHNIVVMGHMWAFRRWFLKSRYSLDEYIAMQTSLLMNEIDTRNG